MLLIEGPRNVGKTFLLKDYKVEKFSSLEYIENKSNDFSWGFTQGKDLMLKYLIKFLPKNTIFDRGFLSTAVYAKLFNRASNNEIDKYLESFIDIDEIKIVYIKGYNPNQRIKDSMDYLNYEDQEKIYDTYIRRFSHINFINNFNEKSVKEFKELLSEHFGL